MLSSSDVKIEGESIVIAPSVILHPKVSILSSPSSRLLSDLISLFNRKVYFIKVWVFTTVFQLESDVL